MGMCWFCVLLCLSTCSVKREDERYWFTLRWMNIFVNLSYLPIHQFTWYVSNLVLIKVAQNNMRACGKGHNTIIRPCAKGSLRHSSKAYQGFSFIYIVHWNPWKYQHFTNSIILKNHKICVFSITFHHWLGANRWKRSLKDRISHIQYHRYHACWWPGDARSQGSNTHGVDFVLREYSSLHHWRHQIETFSALLAFCEGNPPVTGSFLRYEHHNIQPTIP